MSRENPILIQQLQGDLVVSPGSRYEFEKHLRRREKETHVKWGGVSLRRVSV